MVSTAINQAKPIDCAIILTLDGSNRTKGAIKKAHLFSDLVSRIIVQSNPGYKNVRKPLPVQTAEADCAFSHYAACKYALENGFTSILVLEDDFMVEPEFETYKDAIRRDISEFMYETQADHYFLGCSPFLAIPHSSRCGGSWRVIKGGTTHAVIHSILGMEKIVRDWESFSDEMVPIDLYMFSTNSTFMHSCPLVSQTFPDTENKIENWGSSATFSGTISNWFISVMELDEITRPGYDIMYATAKISPVLACLFCTIIVLVYRFLRQRKLKMIK
jgi:hypothetical protein